MKKILLLIFVINLVLLSSFAFAGETTWDFKLGTAYATDPEKFGFQFHVGYYNEFDPFFVFGIEPGIYWIKWEETIGKKDVGNLPVDVKKDTNAYMIPIMANGQIRLPNLRNKLYFLPHVTVGLGYSLMVYNYNQPEYTDTAGTFHEEESETDFYSGITWQLMLGGTFKPGRESNIGFLFEVGFRGAKVQRDDLEVNMTGFIINAGVRYPFESARSSAISAGSI